MYIRFFQTRGLDLVDGQSELILIFKISRHSGAEFAFISIAEYGMIISFLFYHFKDLLYSSRFTIELRVLTYILIIYMRGLLPGV